MELNAIQKSREELRLDDYRAAESGTILDAWMNDLRQMFGKRKKPPRYEKSAGAAASTSLMRMNPLQTFSEESRPSAGLQTMSEPMFGGYVTDSVDPDTGVAKFVLWCVRAIETAGEGLRTDAIYTAIGVQSRVNFITRQDEEVMQKCLEEEQNVPTLAGALKVFFRQLKIPLIDFQDMNRAFQAENPVYEMRLLINSLPTAYQNTLSLLVQHLASVLRLHLFNNTSLVELGVVFGPTLMRLSPNCQDMTGEMKQQNSIVEFLVQECDAIFPRPRDRDESDAETSRGAVEAVTCDAIFPRPRDRDESDAETLRGAVEAVTCDAIFPRPRDRDESDAETSRGAVEAVTCDVDDADQQSHGVANQLQADMSQRDSRPDEDVVDEDAPEVRHPADNKNVPDTVAVKNPPQPPPKPRRVAHGVRVFPLASPQDTRVTLAPAKKSRSTPVDSYMKQASSESSDSDSDSDQDSEDGQEDALPRSVPTAL